MAETKMRLVSVTLVRELPVFGRSVSRLASNMQDLMLEWDGTKLLVRSSANPDAVEWLMPSAIASVRWSK